MSKIIVNNIVTEVTHNSDNSYTIVTTDTETGEVTTDSISFAPDLVETVEIIGLDSIRKEGSHTFKAKYSPDGANPVFEWKLYKSE